VGGKQTYPIGKGFSHLFLFLFSHFGGGEKKGAGALDPNHWTCEFYSHLSVFLTDFPFECKNLKENYRKTTSEGETKEQKV
jgi:hypothetical protein